MAPCDPELNEWRNAIITASGDILPDDAPQTARNNVMLALLSMPMEPFWDDGVSSFTLEEALEANETLQTACVLKEKFRRFREQPTKWTAKVFLLSRSIEAVSVRNQHLTKMAKRLLSHFDRIIAWYDHQISTGPLDGNNKIKVLQRKAYGFRDHEFFQLQMLCLHEKGQQYSKEYGDWFIEQYWVKDEFLERANEAYQNYLNANTSD